MGINGSNCLESVEEDAKFRVRFTVLANIDYSIPHVGLAPLVYKHDPAPKKPTDH